MTEKRFTLIECNGNIEDGCTQIVYDGGEDVFELLDLLNSLNDGNEQLKRENYELHKRLGDFEPFEEHIKERTSKTSLEDIIGIVKTDEPTNSVELKKELYK